MPAKQRTAGTRRPRKRATNVTVDEGLLEQARELDLNLSQLLERGLLDAIGSCRREQWLQESQEAIDHYNAQVDRCGVFSDGLRRF